MSVRKMYNSDVYEYRFQLNGIRYQGSTGTTSKREAERIEAEMKRKALVDHAQQKSKLKNAENGPNLTLVNAIGKYLAAQESSPDINLAVLKSEKRAFQWIAEQIGPGTRMADITEDMVIQLVNKRRGLPKLNGAGVPLKDKNGMAKKVSKSYINRYTSKLLKRIYILARDKMGVDVQPIDWSQKSITLSESAPRKREITIEEELLILSDQKSDPGYLALFEFALLSGLRKENLTSLRWDQVYLDEGFIDCNVKGQKEHRINIIQRMKEILTAQIGNHPEFVFTYTQKKTRTNPKTGAHEAAGSLAPITYAGFSSWFRQIQKRFNIDATIHDIRRTSACRILRYTGNLKAASDHLGHSDVAITAKRYAHVQAEDMRSILEVTEKAVAIRRAEIKSR